MEPGFPDGIHTMRLPDGSFLFPDNEYDAEDFAADGAVPVFPDLFPFDVEPKIVRARVTLTFEVRSRHPVPMTENQLMRWVQERMGRITDNGPYGLGSEYGFAELDFGSIWDGPVEWTDGSAPEHGYHCGDCRMPKDPNAGPCLGAVPWGRNGGFRPCQSDDAQHHGRCFHEQVLGPVPMPKRMP